jgi:hypothetical protein
MSSQFSSRMSASVAGLCCVVGVSGCATLFHGSQMLTVTSEPQGAHVYVAGVDSGVTPRRMNIRREHAPLILQVRADSNVAIEQKIERRIHKKSMVWDVAFPALGALASLADGTASKGVPGSVADFGIAMLFDFGSGAIWDLKVDSVHFKVPPRTGK